MGARSEDKARAAMADVKQAAPDSAGSLTYLHLDLADLRTIKASADAFLARESMLHVLFNNAAVMNPPAGSRSVQVKPNQPLSLFLSLFLSPSLPLSSPNADEITQGYELQLGVNNVGTYLFTKLLTPVLATTARSASVAAGSVRVVWVSSSAAEGLAPACGVPLDGLAPGPRDVGLVRYGISKAGNYFHATEFARRHRADGIVSVPLNPGNLDSDLYRHVPGLITFFLRRTVLYPSVYGAYTELFAGLAPEVTLEKSGSWGTFSFFLSLSSLFFSEGQIGCRGTNRIKPLTMEQWCHGDGFGVFGRNCSRGPSLSPRAGRVPLRLFGTGPRNRSSPTFKGRGVSARPALCVDQGGPPGRGSLTNPRSMPFGSMRSAMSSQCAARARLGSMHTRPYTN